MSRSAYIRWRLFDPASPLPKQRGKFPVRDHQAIARLLALLGASRLSNNVNQLARMANTGSLPFSPEVEAELLAAARDIADMRRLLLDALGRQEGQP